MTDKIVLIGDRHTLHPGGTVLSVVDTPQQIGPWRFRIWRGEAEKLIARGHARWAEDSEFRPSPAAAVTLEQKAETPSVLKRIERAFEMGGDK